MYRAWMEIKKGCKRRGDVGEVDAEGGGWGLMRIQANIAKGCVKKKTKLGGVGRRGRAERRSEGWGGHQD